MDVFSYLLSIWLFVFGSWNVIYIYLYCPKELLVQISWKIFIPFLLGPVQSICYLIDFFRDTFKEHDERT